MNDVTNLSIQNLPIGAFFENLQGIIEGYNKQYVETLGLKPYKGVLESWRSIIFLEDREAVLKEWKTSVESSKPAHFNCRLLKKNGNIIWADIRINPQVDINGQLLGYSGTIIDTTNQMMFEKVLEKFKNAVEKTESQIIFTNSDGVVEYANNAIETLTGYTSGEIVGTKGGKLWGGLMDKEFYAQMWHRIKVEKKAYEGEVINKKKNGETYFAQISITPVLDIKGEVEFFVGIERDITYIKEMDKVKNEFISLASHQLRTPLSSIKWLCELFWDEDVSKLTSDQKAIMQKVQNENERLIKLVNSLLNISRMESNKIKLNPTQIEMGSLLKKVIADFDKRLKAKNQTVELQLDKNLPKVCLDIKLVEEALVNLMSNAHKYTQEGGRIWVKSKSEANELVVSITDSGIGIPVSDQHRVFQKFFRAANATLTQTEGTGLGLYFVKWVVESHNGRVWFESTENVGTTFYLAFPITAKN